MAAYTRDALLDVHERTHRSLRMVIEHAGRLGPEALGRELPGFGYGSVRLQLHHLIGAEEYWIGVLQGKMLVDEDAQAYPTAAALEEYRDRVAGTTREYLRAATDAALNAAREVRTWQGKNPRLVPAHVVMRTAAHIYQHIGQVLAQCRLLGAPGPGGFDFPLDPS